MAAAKVKVVVHTEQVRRYLKGPEMVALLTGMGRAVAAAAGPGHRVDVEIGRNRASVAVFASSWEAKYAEATTRNLTRALQAGRR
jgi:hypothetical protein